MAPGSCSPSEEDPGLCIPLKQSLHYAYKSDGNDRPALIDLRDPRMFLVSRLRDSYNTPLEFLVPRMFLLPDRSIPLGLVVPGPPATQMVRGAAAAGGAKKEIQVTAFLESRGWRVLFCVEATAALWSVATELGVLEEGGCAKALNRRWPFQPSKLLMQQAGLVEELLVKLRLPSGAGQAGTAGVHVGPQNVRAETAVEGRPLNPYRDSVTFRMLDVGCGSGRDLAWLATRQSVVQASYVPDGNAQGADDGSGGSVDVQVTWECVGLDSWHGALQRAAEVLALGDVPAGPGGVTLYLAQIGPSAAGSAGGGLQRLPLPPTSAKSGPIQALRRYLAVGEEPSPPGRCAEPHGTAPACGEGDISNISCRRAAKEGSSGVLEASALGRFDLVVCVRFLERSFLKVMVDLLKPGGVILFSTFVDGPGLRAFGRPQGREHVLQQDELGTDYFGPEQGFEVLRNEVEAIADGREVSMFCARKL